MGRRQRRRDAGSSTSKAGAGTGTGAERSTGRYTAPKKAAYRIRPAYHKVVGVVELLVGLAIVIINYIDLANVRILPGGHQEAYFVLGLVIAAGSTWWFGWFDRTPDPAEIRRQYQRDKDGK